LSFVFLVIFSSRLASRSLKVFRETTTTTTNF